MPNKAKLILIMSTDPRNPSDRPGDINYDALRAAIPDNVDMSLEELEEAAAAIEGKLDADEDTDLDENPAVNTLNAGIRELEAIHENIKVNVDDPMNDPEFVARMKALDERSERIRQQRQEKATEKKRAIKSDQESSRGLAVGLSIAYTIMGVPVAGFLIGWLIDNQLKSEMYKGIGVMVGAVAGISMALFILKRHSD